MVDDGRTTIFEALSLVEDALGDGFRSARPIPEMKPQAPPGSTTDGPDSRSEIGSASGVARGGAAQGDAGRGAGLERLVEARGQARPAAPPADDSLAAIAAEAARCMACRLAAGRSRSVPGQGSARPLVMVIGEGPGAEEDRTGLPFVGPAGQLLDKMLGAIGLSREENCFIGNIVKCRPPMNRDPAPDEQAACLPFLDRQLALLRPRAILAVGRIPAQSLLGVKDGIGRLRGRAFEFRGVPLVATYHPSALLRDDGLKRPAWEDLKLLRSILDGLGA